jgi:hypothetical protein
MISNFMERIHCRSYVGPQDRRKSQGVVLSPQSRLFKASWRTQRGDPGYMVGGDTEFPR